MRKYVAGDVIRSMDDLAEQEFIVCGWIHTKTYHRGWFSSWPYRTVKQMLDEGYIHYAIKVVRDPQVRDVL